MTNQDYQLQALFSESFVLGGSSCSGKSTLAERLSQDFNLQYYKVDDHMWRHLEQADPRSQPTMATYANLSWNEIWSQPVNSQVEDVFAYYAEQFPMILADLQAHADKGPIVMEGAAFLPQLIHGWGIAGQHVVFLVPTKAFQIQHYSQRDWVRPILDSCEDPDQAFANWMERDHLFGLAVVQQARSYQYPVITIDGTVEIDEIYTAVIEHFHLAR